MFFVYTGKGPNCLFARDLEVTVFYLLLSDNRGRRTKDHQTNQLLEILNKIWRITARKVA